MTSTKVLNSAVMTLGITLIGRNWLGGDLVVRRNATVQSEVLGEFEGQLSVAMGNPIEGEAELASFMVRVMLIWP